MTTVLIFLGMLLVFVGFVLLFLDLQRRAWEESMRHPERRPDLTPQEKEYFREPERVEEHPKVEGGGVIFLGPIPIIFGSDTRWALIAAIIGLIIILVFLAFLLLG